MPLQICSPLQVGAINRSVKEKKKSNQRIVLQRGRETWRKERRETVRERERERSMGRGETKVSDSEGVRREKAKGREKK